MELLQNHFLKQSLINFIVVSMCVSSSSVASIAAQVSSAPVGKTTVLLDDQKKEKVKGDVVRSAQDITTEEPPFVASDPAVTVDSGEGLDGMTMLYIGGGIGVVALGVLAIAGGGSSSSDSGKAATPTEPVVGPDINGNWAGFLDIKNTEAEGYQNVTAKIVQNGSAVAITTSSTLSYGQLFNGHISSGGYLTMYDSVTGEDWTTHYTNATANTMDLYDYVNGLQDLDRMYLSR